MAADIEIINNVPQIAYTGKVPWHGMGRHVSNNLTPREMQIAAGVDWTVNKYPTFFSWELQEKPSNFFALVRDRDGKVLSNVPDTWQPVQNSQAFEFFNNVVQHSDCTMETAGSLNGGKIVWALAKLNSNSILKNVDEIVNYVLFANPHQYGRMVTIKAVKERVVCANTLALALASYTDNAVTHTHRKAFDPQDAAARIFSEKANFEMQAQQLMEVEYTEDDVVKYLLELYNNKEKLNKAGKGILEVVENQPGVDLAPKSWWNVFNAVTYYYDHIQQAKRGTQDTRITSSWFGATASTKQKALKLALKYSL